MKVLIETHTGNQDRWDTFSIERSKVDSDMLNITIDRRGSTGEMVSVPVMLDEFIGLLKAFQF